MWDYTTIPQPKAIKHHKQHDTAPQARAQVTSGHKLPPPDELADCEHAYKLHACSVQTALVSVSDYLIAS